MTLSTATHPAFTPDLETSPRDVRPILERTRENAFERTEQRRTDLYHLLEVLCAKRQIEALVLQSPAYVHPAWIKFESWSPTGEPGITARSSVTVNIATRPYHRFECVYKVEWEKHGQKGTFDQVYEFGESEFGRLIDLMTAAPAPVRARRAVKRILKPVQLRQQWWQLWKPQNKVSIIRRDWALIGCIASVVIGLGVLAAASGRPAAFPDDTFSSGAGAPLGQDLFAPDAAGAEPAFVATTPPPSPPPIAEPQPVSRFAVIALGEPIESELDGADLRLDDGRGFEARAFLGRAGTPVVITMRSDDFDTFLIVGRLIGGNFQPLQQNDDGAGDGTNSRLDFTPDQDGEYVVVASSLEPGKTGRYELSVR